jgi:hypothetical protein
VGAMHGRSCTDATHGCVGARQGCVAATHGGEGIMQPYVGSTHGCIEALRTAA